MEPIDILNEPSLSRFKEELNKVCANREDNYRNKIRVTLEGPIICLKTSRHAAEQMALTIVEMIQARLERINAKHVEEISLIIPRESLEREHCDPYFHEDYRAHQIIALI